MANQKNKECEKLGHNIKCETTAGPESGSDDIWCKRCGKDFSVIYY
jgi:hypothetical protein